MSWKLKLLPAGLLAALGTLAGASPAAAWDVVGQREVASVFLRAGWTCKDNGGCDAEIRVAGHRQYRQIKLCVDPNPVHFHDLRIEFRQDEHQDVTIRRRIDAGECTRVIELEGGARRIRNIKLLFDGMTLDSDDWSTASGLRRSIVRVYAQ